MRRLTHGDSLRQSQTTTTASVLTRLRHAGRVLAPAKLNLNFRILDTRPDRYHLIDSVVVPISIWDAIDVQVERARTSEVVVRCRPGGIPEGPENLVFQAARAILRRVSIPLRVKINVVKDIPAGAGLGGGSSDAAAVLMLLRNWLSPELGDGELTAIALHLGADLPFFLQRSPARVSGVGECISPLPGPGYAHWFVVVFDRMPLATADVFREFDRACRSLTSSESQSIFPRPTGNACHAEFVNDLELAACRLFPGIYSLKESLSNLGASRPRMTGSGSAVFGEFENGEMARRAARELRKRGLWARAAQTLLSPVA